MPKKIRDYLLERPTFFRWVFGIAFGVTAGLFIGGFLVPPRGEISGSLLKASSILLAFGVVSMLPDIIKSGAQAKFQHGDTSVTIGADND